MLKEEFERGISNRNLLVSIIIGIVALLWGLTYYTAPFGIFLNNMPPSIHPLRHNSYDAVIWSIEPLYLILVPLFSALPFASSYVEDRNSGYIDLVLIRTTFKRYLFAKGLVNFVMGGLAASLPLTLIFLLTLRLYPHELPPLGSIWVRLGTGPWGTLHELYRLNTDLYVVVLIFQAFIFGGVYGTIGLAFSIFLENRYVAVVTPFLFYLSLQVMMELLALIRWAPFASIDPLFSQYATNTSSLLQFAAILCISLLILKIYAGKENVYVRSSFYSIFRSKLNKFSILEPW